MKKSAGRATVEYIIILPIVFACLIAVITIYSVMYQRSLVQSLAESAAEGLAMVWGHSPLDYVDIGTGSYSRRSYDNREVYWQIKFFGKEGKKEAARTWIMERLKGAGIMRQDEDMPPSVVIGHKAGFPFSKVTVRITTNYRVPGAGLLKLIGFGDILVAGGYAEATIYDQKDLINNTDYVIQKLKKLGLDDAIAKLAEPLKKGLRMLGFN
jgi:hypothetical protein